MQFGRSRFPFPVPFPFPLSALPLCCSPSAVFLSEFVASLRHLLYEQLFACHWISPCPSPRTLPFSPPATVLIFDMTNVRRLIRPQTTRSSPKPANLLRCSALLCTALRSGNRSHVLITRKGDCPAMPRPLPVTCHMAQCIQHLLFSA